ncbi:MAG: 4Fe-4S binding protein [Mogibacterium sp.]|nr:4Fe-4S binding protein [Mogibacterium sp.]
MTLNISKNNLKKIHAALRLAIQILFFTFIPSAYSAAFAGVRYIFMQIGMTESIGFTPFIAALIALLIYTIIFGRFFCGYACAFGSAGDWLYGLRMWISRKVFRRGKRGKKWNIIPPNIMEWLSYIKYVNLILIVILCAVSQYDKFHGISPWELFAKLRSGSIDIAGYAVGVAVLIAIALGMMTEERFFCRVLCPMGAVFAIMPALPFFSLRRTRGECIKGCAACTNICPSDVELPNDGSLEVSSDCFQCQKCIGICPKSNVHCGLKILRGNEMWFTILRAGMLFVLLKSIGV